MQRFKRILRLLAFICLIVLASIGIGLSGGVPLFSSIVRKDKDKDNTELVEETDVESDTDQSQIKG